MTFTYDINGLLETVTHPSGQTQTFFYDTTKNLIKIEYPDGSEKLYHYENASFAHHLTGISYVEPDTTTTRYSTYAYDSSGKAISTEHAGGVQEFTLTYDSATQTTVDDALGTEYVYTFSENLGVKNLVSKVNQTDSKSLAQTFDSSNNLTCRKDEEGNVTTYTYNSSNQRISMTEGQTGTCASPTSTAATRTTTYDYVSADLDLLTTVTAPSVKSGEDKTTTIAYGDSNHPYLPTTITQSGFTPSGTAVTRSTTLTYTTDGQLATVNGPRTDVTDTTTFDYYDCTTGDECGQLESVTNALSQVTTFDTYDGNGRVTQMTDPNGVETDYTYDGRGRVTSIVQTPTVGTARTTGYTYNAAGNVTSVTFPDSTTLTYTYNAAQLLTRVTDEQDNYISYTYDLKGNRTEEKVYDPNDTLVRQVTTAYDLRNRVSSINAGGSLTELVYDAIGNLTEETDPNENPSTTHDYDALSRLTETVDAISGETTYDYTVTDQLAEVVTPNGATTQYVYDDLGNLLEEVSPDRGTTDYTYDAAGNALTRTDARNITATYSYDALNRLTAVDYPGTSEDIAYTYDSDTLCTAGVGRLCTVTDASGTTEYSYDDFGNVTEQNKTELGETYTTDYSYDARDRITEIVYPNGRTVTYTRDSLGRITAVSATVNGSAQTLLSSRSYRADGVPLGQTFGNSLAETRTYNGKGELTAQTFGSADSRTYTYDDNGNLITLLSTPLDAGYTYDALNRLTEDDITSTPTSTIDYTYDGNGNRTSDGGSYTYTTDTNRLTQTPTATITLDDAGNTTGDGTYTYSYNNDGHLYQVLDGANVVATYTYNYLRQRTRKVVGSTTTVYHYDLAGNLISETQDDATLIRDYIWLDGAPIAQIDYNGTTDTVTYLHADHLNTPRLGTDGSQNVVWGWEGNAFGDTAPTGTITVNLRFPGQYFDAETGFHYNWNRYYDPRTGRYITSDPIGLESGINTYSYVSQNPVKFSDFFGLRRVLPTRRPWFPIYPTVVPNDQTILCFLNPRLCYVEPLEFSPDEGSGDEEDGEGSCQKICRVAFAAAKVTCDQLFKGNGIFPNHDQHYECISSATVTFGQCMIDCNSSCD